MQLTSALAAATLAGVATAHGSIDWIRLNGQVWQGASPYNSNPSPMWRAQNGDNGFVSSPSTLDVACHKSAVAPSQTIPVTAGDTLELHWSNGFNHPGPVLNYLAPTAGTTAGLNFFKISATGVLPAGSTGVWGSDVMIANNNTARVTIPTSIKSGAYTLRHEIIALHSAGSVGGAQFYPFCFNLQVTSPGSAAPAGQVATTLYKATDPGILINIYNPIIKAGSAYTIPGPAIPSSIVSKKRQVFNA